VSGVGKGPSPSSNGVEVRVLISRELDHRRNQIATVHLGLAKQRFKPSALRPRPRHREKESSFALYTTFTTFTHLQTVNVVNIVKDALQRTPHARDASPRRTTLTDSIEQE